MKAMHCIWLILTLCQIYFLIKLNEQISSASPLASYVECGLILNAVTICTMGLVFYYELIKKVRK